MPDHATDGEQIDPRINHLRRCRVPQVVEVRAWEAGRVASRVPADMGGTLAGTYEPFWVRWAGTTVSPGAANAGPAQMPSASSAAEATGAIRKCMEALYPSLELGRDSEA